MTGKKVFISYSSKDQAKAEQIREALESSGVPCWIAPRDLAPGSQWGAAIVQGIMACQAVVVVFTANANASPQIAREMELAVANRRPLIPIRVADDMPTDDMKYFLGVSHWFDAHARPLETYLPAIVLAVGQVLRNQASPWATLRRRLPQGRQGQLILAVAIGALLVMLTAVVRGPPLRGAQASPLQGRWEARLDNGQGGMANCVFDVKSDGQAAFGDGCPDPLMAANGALQSDKSGLYATAQYKSGDTGSFVFQGGSGPGFYAAFRKAAFGGLTTRDARFGEVEWRHAAGKGPLSPEMDKVLPTGKVAWPLAEAPAIARRAQTYVRAKWKPDAVLTSIDIKLLKSNESGSANLTSDRGGVSIVFGFYSPEAQKLLSFTPNTSNPLFVSDASDRSNVTPLPDRFLDLPDAVARLPAMGVRAKQIYEAKLQDWGYRTTAGFTSLSGVEWLIDTQLDERRAVPADGR